MGAGGEEEGGGGIGDYPCGHIRGEGEHGPSLSLWPFRCRLSLFVILILWISSPSSFVEC